MDSPFTTTSTPIRGLHIGQPVLVNCRNTWLPAMITFISHRRIGVSFTADQPARHQPIVPPWAVRPAIGMQLHRAMDLSEGDTVITFTGDLKTVAHEPLCRDGWSLIDYTNGDHVVMPSTAVLRLQGQPRTPRADPPPPSGHILH